MARGDTLPTPADGILIVNLTKSQADFVAEQLHLNWKADEQEATSDGNALEFTLGTPQLILVDGQEQDSWKPSDFDPVTEIISNMNYQEGSIIKIYYREKYPTV